ncbi:hypothetical protein AAG906_001189 [Vitis piasezkii]
MLAEQDAATSNLPDAATSNLPDTSLSSKTHAKAASMHPYGKAYNIYRLFEEILEQYLQFQILSSERENFPAGEKLECKYMWKIHWLQTETREYSSKTREFFEVKMQFARETLGGNLRFCELVTPYEA